MGSELQRGGVSGGRREGSRVQLGGGNAGRGDAGGECGRGWDEMG